MLGWLIVLEAAAFSSPDVVLAILVAWAIFGGDDMDWGLVRGIGDFFSSMGSYREPIAGTDGYERVNRVAREYYMAVYGGAVLPRWARWLRFCAALIGFFLATIFCLQVGMRAHHALRAPKAASWAESAAAMYAGAAFSLWLQLVLSYRRTGQKTRRQLRRFWAQRLTAPFGGPGPFLDTVKRMGGGRIPEMSAWVLAPYWPDTTVSLGIVALLASVVPGLTLFPHAAASGHGKVVFGVALIGFALAAYTTLLVLAMTPEWEAVQRRDRYFPLHALCKDLTDG